MGNIERYELINKIVDRYITFETTASPKLDILMDVDFADQDCPLDLERLLAADNLNFMHDLGGIRRHLNRRTKKLMDGFTPRYAKRG